MAKAGLLPKKRILSNAEIPFKPRAFEKAAYTEEFGIRVARRGWAEKKNILNTLPVKQFLGRLKGSGTPA